MKSTNKLSFILFKDDTNLFCSGDVIKKTWKYGLQFD